MQYCDFFVYTNKEYYVERILPNPAFWLDIVGKYRLILRNPILPELVAKYYPRDTSSVNK